MEKTVTREQMNTILEGRPKGVSGKEIIDTYIANGYKVEGINYEKPKPTLMDKAKDYATEAITNPVETAKGVIKGIPGQAAGLVKLAEMPGKAITGKIADVAGVEAPQGLDYTAVEELTAPSNKAQQVGYVASGLLPIERAVGGAELAVKGLTGGANVVKAGASKVSNVKTSLGAYAENAVKNETNSLLSATRSVKKASDLATKKGIPLGDILSDPTIFKGIKVEGGKINPAEAVQTLDDRITQLVDAKRSLLPEFDRLVAPQPKEIIRKRAYADIAGKFTPADEKVLKQSIDSQIDALPNELRVSDIDALRAQFRASARDAKGLQKSSSEYSALENAARDTVFDLTDNINVPNAAEYKSLNDTIKQWIGAKDFLETSLNGQTIKGGRLQNYVAKGIGAMAGAQSGPLGTILGAEVGGAISNVIVNNQLGSSIKMKLIKELTDDPEIIKKAEQLVEQAKTTNLLMLPAPSGKVGATGKEVIEALSSRKDRSIGFPDQK